MDNKERTPKEKALYFQNSLRGFRSEVENAMGEFIREYGKQSDVDPNVYIIEIKEEDKVYLDERLVYGTIMLDVSYYEGTIFVSTHPNSNICLTVEFTDFPIKEQIHLYHKLVNLYANK